MLTNNMAFAYAELGDLKRAKELMSRLSHSLDAEAVFIATLGLIHFRGGDAERGAFLYERAIGRTFDHRNKRRLRQKLVLEQARYFSERDAVKSSRLIAKALNEKDLDFSIRAHTHRVVESLGKLIPSGAGGSFPLT